MSKGEGGRGQRGGTFVVIDTDSMRLLEERPSCQAYVCQADHVLISPDGTEVWISNNMGYITVFDLKTLAMKAEITMPKLADPHGGVFVQYDKTGKGHVVMDVGGPHGGVSPYLSDNQQGIPTLAQALAKGWSGAVASSPLALKGAPGVGAKFFRGLGDPTRIRILQLLIESERTVGDWSRRGGSRRISPVCAGVGSSPAGAMARTSTTERATGGCGRYSMLAPRSCESIVSRSRSASYSTPTRFRRLSV